MKWLKPKTRMVKTEANSNKVIPDIFLLVRHLGYDQRRDDQMEPYATDLTLSFGLCFYLPFWLFFNLLYSCHALPHPLASPRP